MAASPEVMSALKGGPAPQAKPSTPQADGPTPGPMLTPQKASGHAASARAAVQVAAKVLEQTLPAWGDTEEREAVLNAIKAISKVFGEQESKDKELMPAEIQQLLSGLAGPGAPSPGMPGPPPPPGAGAGAPPPGGAPPPPPGPM